MGLSTRIERFTFLILSLFWLIKFRVSAFAIKDTELQLQKGLFRGKDVTSEVFLSSSSLEAERETDDESVPLMASTDRQNRNVTLDPWLARVIQLCEYRQKYGTTNVPRRFKDKGLSNFVSKQRQLYKKYLANETPCSLTKSRVEILDRLDFVWNATSLAANSTASANRRIQRQNVSENVWWKQLADLQSFIEDKTRRMQSQSGEYFDSDSQLTISAQIATMMAVAKVPSKSRLGLWLTSQRKEFRKWKQRLPSIFSQEKSQALASLDRNWWMSSRERIWNINYLLVIQYKEEYGDTIVPISFRSRKLAHWVSTQRKNYNLKNSGQRSSLTNAREARLEAIGFVWNRWEYEFNKKLMN